MQISIDPSCNKIVEEPAFRLFRYKEMLCCIQRHMHFGYLNGYVAVEKDHPLYGKHYRDKVYVPDNDNLEFNNNWIGALCAERTELNAGIVPLDLAINVHCGLTFAADHAPCIDKDIFRNHWWFGFDTGHSGDLMPFVYEGLQLNWTIMGYSYKDYNFVLAETKKLADQLAAFMPEKSDIEVAAANYFIKRKG